MAVGLDLDTESLQRTGIPGGGAGTLSDGAFANCAILVWLYRPSSGNSYGLTADGCIIHGQAGAREIKLGFDNTFGAGTASDPLLQAIFNSGGGAGTPVTFAGANFFDEWVCYVFYEASATQHAGYIRLSSLSTFTKQSRANDNAGSQFINTLTFGNHSGGGTAVMGRYAYARAFYASGITDSDIIAWAANTAPVGGEWGFWPLANNADNGDDSGNARDLTFTGTLTSESDPPLGGTPVTGAGGIASAEAFGTATLTRTSVQQVTGTGIASAEAFGTATVSRRAAVADAGGIASAETFGTATLTRTSGSTVSPSGIASAEAFGTVAFSRLTGTTVAPAGIASAEAFGAATLTRTSVQQVTGAGIASAEAFGTALLTRVSARTVTGAGGVASAEAFGTPVFARAAVQQIVVPGIVSAEAFGTAALTARRAFTPTSIASAEAFGSTTFTRDGSAPAATQRRSRISIRIGISL